MNIPKCMTRFTLKLIRIFSAIQTPSRLIVCIAIGMLCFLSFPIHYTTAQAISSEGFHINERPERVILLYMDGLHPKAIEQFDMTAIQKIQKRGTTAEVGIMSFPAHPTVLPFGDHHFTSAPNVTTMTGTLFLEPRPRYLHHQFQGLGKTLHAAGSHSYRSLNIGFDYAFTTGGASDAELIDYYIQAFEREGDIVFARIMLQQLGNAGRKESGKNLKGDPWAQDIFHPKSPYGMAAKEANRQIGLLVDYLTDMGKIHSTLFIIMGDGQSPHGWHLTLDPESALTPIIFAGPGIKKGEKIPYAENIDVAPTIAAIMGISPPNADGGSGRVLTNILIGGKDLQHPRYIERINEQIRQHYKRHAQAVLKAFQDPKMNLLIMELDHHLLSDHQFFTVERFMEWHEADSPQAMIKANDWVLETLRLALEENIYRFGTF